jgi:long-chain fatty acid transport protein
MGGTGVASSEGWEATYTNPALLSLVHRNMITLGMSGAAFDLHADGPQLPGRVSVLPSKGFIVGVQVPVPFGGVLRDRVATGFAFYTPTGALVRGRILYPETPEFPLLPDRSQSLAVRLGVGADLGHGLRAGAGFAALANLVGSIVIVNTGTISSRVDDKLIATYAPTFGVTWDLPFDRAPDGAPRWRVGAMWRGSIGATFGVDVDASKLSTLNLPLFNIAGIAQYDPPEAAIEIAHEQGGWTLAAGATWKHWSAYPGVFEPTILCPPDHPDCTALTPPQIGFSDTIVPRVGVERVVGLPRHAAVRLRGGFFYEPTPVPSSLPGSQAYDLASQGLINVPTRFFDTSRYVLSLGGGVDMGDVAPFTVDFWAQLHVLAGSSVQTCTGDNTPCTPDIGTGPAQLSGAVVAYGAMAGVRF